MLNFNVKVLFVKKNYLKFIFKNEGTIDFDSDFDLVGIHKIQVLKPLKDNIQTKSVYAVLQHTNKCVGPK